MDQAPKKRHKEEFESFYREFPVDKDTSCGYSVFRGSFLQFSATKNIFVVINGMAGCLMIACFTYFSGSISSIEKLYGIPSQRSGMLSVGNDISQVLVGVFFSYFLANKHRPRWMAFGVLCFGLYAFICALPHLIYGTGPDVLLLTKEYGDRNVSQSSVSHMAQESGRTLCLPGNSEEEEDSVRECESGGNVMPQVILFVAQIVAGVGGGIYSALNGAYLDDNVEKSKAPWVISKWGSYQA